MKTSGNYGSIFEERRRQDAEGLLDHWRYLGMENWREPWLIAADETYEKALWRQKEPAPKLDAGRFTPLRNRKVGMTPDDIREAGPVTAEDYRAVGRAKKMGDLRNWLETLTEEEYDKFMANSAKNAEKAERSRTKALSLKPAAERPEWPQTMLDIAVVLSDRGTCPRLRAGAVVTTHDYKIVGTGYNGAPRGVGHCTDVGCSISDGHCVRAVHAEQNAVMHSIHSPVSGMKLFTTHRPCIVCARMLVQFNFEEVYYLYSYDTDGLFGLVQGMFEERRIKLVQWSNKK